MTSDAVPGCYSCGWRDHPSPPPREDVLHTDHWRVALAFNSTLPGWIVLQPSRHLTCVTDLSVEAADELGGLMHRLSRALEQVTGCVKTYVMQFSEQEGFSHLHFHLVPRMPDQPESARGPKVFTYLAADEPSWIPEPERDALALQIRAAVNDQEVCR